MPRPDVTHRSKKKLLTLAAFELFIKQGYERTTIAQIMEAAKLTKAGIYHYYSSKEDVLDAAIAYALEQDTENLARQIKSYPVEKRMLLLMQGALGSNGLVSKLFHYHYTDRDLYAAYRIRELTVHAYIPFMEHVIREGIEKGLYRTKYPAQAAGFIIILGKCLSECSMPGGKEKQEYRFQAFLELIEALLKPSLGHMADIRQLCEKYLQGTYGKNEKNFIPEA